MWVKVWADSGMRRRLPATVRGLYTGYPRRARSPLRKAGATRANSQKNKGARGENAAAATQDTPEEQRARFRKRALHEPIPRKTKAPRRKRRGRYTGHPEEQRARFGKRALHRQRRDSLESG